MSSASPVCPHQTRPKTASPKDTLIPAEGVVVMLPPPPVADTDSTAVLAEPPQTLTVPLPPHDVPVAHVPQLSVPPQPFATLPQLLPSCAQVDGVHATVGVSVIRAKSRALSATRQQVASCRARCQRRRRHRERHRSRPSRHGHKRGHLDE